MPKLISFETFDLANQRPDGYRLINVEHVIELVGLDSYNGRPLTRIKLINGDHLDVLRNTDDLKRELEGELS